MRSLAQDKLNKLSHDKNSQVKKDLKKNLNNTFSINESHNPINLPKAVSNNSVNQPRKSNYNLCIKETEKENVQ